MAARAVAAIPSGRPPAAAVARRAMVVIVNREGETTSTSRLSATSLPAP
jgi:hypothetical protein